jgi:hypothetical protein
VAGEERRLIEGIFDGDEETVRALTRSLDSERVHRVMLGAFTLAVHRQFPGEYTPEHVSAFVADLRRRLENGEQLNPMPTEALVRSALDEPDLRRGINAQDAFNAYVAVTFAYGQDHNLHGLEREEFVAEVLEAVG